MQEQNALRTTKEQKLLQQNASRTKFAVPTKSNNAFESWKWFLEADSQINYFCRKLLRSDGLAFTTWDPFVKLSLAAYMLCFLVW